MAAKYISDIYTMIDSVNNLYIEAFSQCAKSVCRNEDYNEKRPLQTYQKILSGQ